MDKTRKSKGCATRLTVGGTVGPQGGLGKAIFTGGGSETFAFLGTGFNLLSGRASGSVSIFGSHTDGDSLFQYSMGVNGDAGLARTGGGVGVYANTDSATSCVDHNFH